jgi:3' terminal RNA ribose 2'-O-methyltransferase Hen1
VLLTITLTRPPATDLGWLLHKHPARPQSFDLAFGRAHVFYPEAADDRCTAALLLDVDAVGLVRGRRQAPAGDGGLLEQYVNDRPYVASSFLSVAIAQVYGSALAGKCRDRPSLPEEPLPLSARLEVLPCRGGPGFLGRLFGPLGYEVSSTRHPLDERFPEWGDGPYHSVELRATCRLRDLLAHLYVLVPVLDDEKHYWVGDDEVEKLLRHGEGWLSEHPERDRITERYLKRQRHLVRDALERLLPEGGEPAEGTADAEEEALEAPLSLHRRRLAAVADELKACGASRVLDLGCGEGKLLRLLLDEPQFAEIVGVDVSAGVLERAAGRLDRLPTETRSRVRLLHGSLTYRDARLAGFDAAAVVEVVEHLDPDRLSAFERVLFAHARPRTVVLTTPNREYNVRFDLPSGRLRHRDHRFEWTRAEFRAWAEGVAGRHGYTVRFAPLGAEDPELGPPSQMAVFTASPRGA